ncbi:hypothetical protein Adi01nite_10780 [Amorphoplanes digitatis]|nr:hypothetical protein Adi01nite_10780 [Actinoplanes digitatis]
MLADAAPRPPGRRIVPAALRLKVGVGGLILKVENGWLPASEACGVSCVGRVGPRPAALCWAERRPSGADLYRSVRL